MIFFLLFNQRLVDFADFFGASTIIRVHYNFRPNILPIKLVPSTHSSKVHYFHVSPLPIKNHQKLQLQKIWHIHVNNFPFLFLLTIIFEKQS